MPFYPFFGEGSPSKIDYRRKKSWYPYSNLLNLEDLGVKHLIPHSQQNPPHDGNVGRAAGICSSQPGFLLFSRMLAVCQIGPLPPPSPPKEKQTPPQKKNTFGGVFSGCKPPVKRLPSKTEARMAVRNLDIQRINIRQGGRGGSLVQSPP